MSNYTTLGIGAYASYYSLYSEEDAYSLSAIAVKPVFHFAFFNSSKFDFYAGGLAGMIYYQEQVHVGNGIFTNDYIVPYTDILIGTKWMLKDNFGLFAELHGFIPNNIGGVTLKF